METLLGIDMPIVLGPFGGLSSIELTAAVSNGGGLGSYGLYGYTPERIHEAIAAAPRGDVAAVRGQPLAADRR